MVIKITIEIIIHTHSLFSGVYYISTPKDCGNIRVLNGHVKTMSYNWSTCDILNWI